MKAFHTIANPHADIVSGRLTMDIFAADLWQVAHNEGPTEYRDADLFFQKTYETEGLKSLLKIIRGRIEGKGGDPVIQLQTPFGGGKTHSLIAIYHRARKEWDAKTVVIVGTNLEASTTLWGLLERQLMGKNELLTEFTSPGKDKLRKLLEPQQPLVILIDELLEYMTKASGYKVGESNLGGQTLAFIQELTETVSSLEKVSLVITLPSSHLEHYDNISEQMYAQLQKVTGRMEKIYTPVQDSEIASVIRQRLFRNIEMSEVKKVVNEFIKYAEKEEILPSGVEITQYRDRFLASYPFMPEVIDVLYHRWGSLPNFQRTRGVLRLLALVVGALIKEKVPYISVADFPLMKHEVREELLRYCGSEFNSVIAQDITDYNSGSERINRESGSMYKNLKLGTRTATTIFMYSFSGGEERGATLSEIKRCSTTIGNPSSAVTEAIEQLKNKLFYIQYHGGKYYFSNKPNINRILLTKKENVQDSDIQEMERELLLRNTKHDKLRVYIWERNPSNIPDTNEMKLVILPWEDKDVILNMIQKKGASPRVNCNTVFFLFPMESEREMFKNVIREYKAHKSILEDMTLQISDEQKKNIQSKVKEMDKELVETIRRLYRQVGIPTKEGYKIDDLGIATHGNVQSIVAEVYERLRSQGEILERIAPIVVKERYLKGKDYVITEQILNASYRVPGESRLLSKSVLEDAIKEGVSKGMFGLGELSGDKAVCRYFKEVPNVSFENNEVIIAENLCEPQKRGEEKSQEPVVVKNGLGTSYSTEQIIGKEAIESKREDIYEEELELNFPLPKGKVSDVMQVIKFIDGKFKEVQIIVRAREGKITRQEREKIYEALRQLGIEF
ncbi:MAG: DUF499 domain-containing protein [Candidatus Hydrogenedens sp.]|nr:DUF499 domain-containing protein [Candidatus Hydrogenedens sp.]